MSSSVNYDDIFEEFVRLTSSPKSEQVSSSTSSQVEPQPVVELSDIKQEITDILDESPLRVLTPPSPLSVAPTTTQEIAPSSFPFTPLTQVDTVSSVGETTERMCDSDQLTPAPNLTSTATGNQVANGGKQLSDEGDSTSTNFNHGQSFFSGAQQSALFQQGQQQQTHTHNMAPTHLGNMGMETQHPHHLQQPAHNMQMHSMQGNGCAGLQQHLMDNHHHHVQQQMNLAHQQHGVYHGHVQSLPHHAHASHPQQYVPFGMQMNSHNIGNGSQYTMNQFHPIHQNHGLQIPNQQSAHAMGLTPLQQTCFMQQHAAIMQFQHNNPQSPAMMNSQRPSTTVGWINGSSSGQIPNQNSFSTNNHNNISNVAPAQIGGRPKSTATSASKQTISESETNLPGGLEVLWRELPADCQTLFIPQDIPDTAKFRGYFTVSELLVLKRQLQARYSGYLRAPPPTTAATQGPLNKILTGGISKGEGHGRKGPRRGAKERLKLANRSASNNGKENGTPFAHKGRDTEKNLRNYNNNLQNYNLEEPMQQVTEGTTPDGDLMISMGNIKHEINTNVSSAVTEIGGAVKEAMEALSSSHVSLITNSQNGNEKTQAGKDSDSDELIISETANTSTGETESSAANTEEASNSNILEQLSNAKGASAILEQLSHSKDTSNMLEHMDPQKEGSNILEQIGQEKEASNKESPSFPLLPSMPVFSNLFLERANAAAMVESILLPKSVGYNSNGGSSNFKDENDTASPRQNHLLTLALASTSGESLQNNALAGGSTVQINTTVAPGVGYYAQLQLENRYSGPPPPSRTATLVFKLLQIGAYHIRSFSSVNPNRLRVLFNTQRMTYECQLPIIQPINPGSETAPASPMRKVLTVDIGFEQISMIRFGPDFMCMRVEGAPILTISINQALNETGNEVITPQDQFLLDQVEKGQLKLSPIHQLYFLNERLVHQLESQLRAHPKFKHLLINRVQPF